LYFPGGWYLDDLMDKLGFEGFDGLKAMFADGLPKIYDVWKGKYRELEAVPTTPPEFIPAFKIFWLGSKLVHTDVPEFGKCFEHTQQRFEEWVQSSNLALRKNFIKKYSSETYKLIRAYEVGVKCSFEFTFQILRQNLSKEIRSTVLVELIMDLYAVGVGLCNDLLGLKRDIKYAGSNNYVIRVAKEQNLEEAVRVTLFTIQHHLNDLQVALDLLAETYPEDESVCSFITALSNCCNGQIVFHCETKRYGAVSMNIQTG
jgi:hypothetical protein